MSTTIKKKLCWNCEGNVPRDAKNCPYCGVYLHRDEDEEPEEELDEHHPPYSIDTESDQQTIPPSPYHTHQDVKNEDESVEQTPLQIMQGKNADWKIVVLPLAGLLGGSLSLLFSVMLLLFSHNGTFTVQWNADYWFVYLLISIPLLVLGWKSLQWLQDDTGKS